MEDGDFKVMGDWARGVVTSTFGEGAGKIFDGLMGALNTLINAFLVWKIIGKKLFEALIQNIKNAWKIAAAIVKRAINFAKNAINFAKNLIKNVGKFLNKIPGVKNILKGDIRIKTIKVVRVKVI